MTDRPGIEKALARALAWVLAAASLSLPLLLIPAPDSTGGLLNLTLVHLGGLVVLGLLVVSDLSRTHEGDWFTWLGPTGRHLASGASVVALGVGVVALVTLASSAALRLQPSLQFLQLLSALDITWAAGATMIGVRWWRGRRAGDGAGWVVAVVCVWSIWNYLRLVGFTEDGGWLVDASALLRYVLPYDTVAAVVAAGAMIMGSRRAARSLVVR